MTSEALQKTNDRREKRGMRKIMWHESVKGLVTVIRVLPKEFVDLVG